MKYNTLPIQSVREYKVSGFDGGLNLHGNSSLISDTQLSDVSNMWYNGLKLCTRPAIVAAKDGIYGGYDEYGRMLIRMQITDTFVETNGQRRKIAYQLWGDEVTYETLYIYLIDTSGKVYERSSINFRRITDNEFFRFKGAYFIVGTPCKASGIYAFVTRYGYGEMLYEIYEYSEENNGWIKLSDEDYYTPVVYMNGRGTRYDELENLQNLYKGEPFSPEEPNLLNGRFKAYFTSDGYSSVFKLPFSNLDESKNIGCRIYQKPNVYTDWLIPAGENENTQIFMTYNVTMKCDRKTGYISFYVNDEDFSVPKSSSVYDNNIYFTATKSIADGPARVIGSKRCTVFNSNIYLCGNDIAPEEIYSAHCTNPLYFPENMKTAVEKGGGAVNAISAICNKLIAFKDYGVYKLNVTVSTKSDIHTTPIGVSDDFFKTDKLTSEPVNLKVGCSNPETICACANRLVWLGSDRRVYALATTTYGKENNVYEVSLPVRDILNGIGDDEINSVSAVDFDGYYILFFKKRALALDYRIKNFGITPTYTTLKDGNDSIAWYLWQLPENTLVTSGFSLDGVTVLICGDTDLMLGYAAHFGDGNDVVALMQNGQLITKSLPVHSSMCSKMFDFDCGEKEKFIDEVYLNISAGDNLTILFSDGKKVSTHQLRFKEKGETVVKLKPFLRGVNRIKFTAVSSGNFEITKITFKYRCKAG